MELTQIEKKLPEIEASRWPTEKRMACGREIDYKKEDQCAILGMRERIHGRKKVNKESKKKRKEPNQ